jgi:hypothetical protein
MQQKPLNWQVATAWKDAPVPEWRVRVVSKGDQQGMDVQIARKNQGILSFA